MNIMLIFPGKVWGGAEQYVLDLGMALSAAGHNVTYVCRSSEAVTSRLDGRVDFSVIEMGSIFDRKSAKKLSLLLDGIDVVHLHEAVQVRIVMQAAAIAGVSPRVVLTRHIARASRTMPWHKKAMKGLHRMIFVSDLARTLWCGANKWMPEDRCVTIHNSIPPFKDNARGAGEDLRVRYGLPDNVPLIMFTGRVRKSKGCAIIVEALARLKELRWMMLFVGTCKPSDYDKELLVNAREAGIADRIGFYGFSDNVRALLRQADIGVAPSIVREACPLSPMEFMQASKCIIATNNGAQPEYITHNKTGLLVAPNSVDELESALREAITNSEKRMDIGRAAGAFFESNMNYTSFINAVTEAYQ